jgi:anthranilate/para-aminobenzoate synthase component II
VIDNYDSFTYNLVQYLGELGAEVEVVRNDRADVDELLERGRRPARRFAGPCTTPDAGISREADPPLRRGGHPRARRAASVTSR